MEVTKSVKQESRGFSHERFNVDTSALNTQVRRSGTIGTYENYSGDIVSIQKIE